MFFSWRRWYDGLKYGDWGHSQTERSQLQSGVRFAWEWRKNARPSSRWMAGWGWGARVGPARARFCAKKIKKIDFFGAISRLETNLDSIITLPLLSRKSQSNTPKQSSPKILLIPSIPSIQGSIISFEIGILKMVKVVMVKLRSDTLSSSTSSIERALYLPFLHQR